MSHLPIRQSTIVLTSLILLVSLTACDSVKKDDNNEGSDNSPNISSDSGKVFNIQTDDEGIAELTFRIPSGTTKVGVTANGGGFLSFVEASDDLGSDFISPNGEFLTLGLEPQSASTTITIPSRITDPRLDSDTLYHLRIFAGRSDGASPSPIEGEEIEVNVTFDSDNNLSGGSINANLYVVGDLIIADGLNSVLAEARKRAQDIYRSSAGIKVSFNVIEITGPSVLPDPSVGSSFYANATSENTSLGVNVFIGEDVNVDGSEVLGVAASVPGSPFPSGKSAVAISMISSAGIDGSFDQEEIRILGETIAHEMGHYLGLFHPVEIDSDTEQVVDIDPLTDTNSCRNLSLCVQDPSLAANLMFPFPVQDGEGISTPQGLLSRGQAGVLNGYIAVD